jgi:surface carbohydrate biosynthesis protein
MSTKVSKPLLLIPVENQVRELDPKVLLACEAAKRGFTSIIGSRREMELSIDTFPRSVYLSKSMTVRSLLFFVLAHRLGHEIVTWDEEALVHLPPETYYSRRLNSSAIRYVSHLFAWGQDNVELWQQYPHLPDKINIHITGNPRSDMLRPELRSFYRQEVEGLQKTYGNFILVATNFNHVNAFGQDMNLFKPVKNPGETPKFGRAARGMTRHYAEGLHRHKQAIFNAFQKLIPFLDRTFPDYTIVVRPHPTESHTAYQAIADRCERVKVTNEGNIVPWLMACLALVHNGCTTGVEANVLDVPAISYRAVVDDDYDFGFYRLPNTISYQCFTLEQLQGTLQRILDGYIGVFDGDERGRILKRYMSAQQGPLACERIVDVLDQVYRQPIDTAPDTLLKLFERWILAKGLHLVKRFKASWPGSHNRPEFQRHRFPGISRQQLRSKIEAFQPLIGSNSVNPEIHQVSDVIFRISP